MLFLICSSSSLFTVNSSHAFVHVQPCTTDFDPVAILLNTLAKPAINTQWGKVFRVTVLFIFWVLLVTSMLNISVVDSSPLLRNSKFLKREVPESEGDSDLMNSGDDVLFRGYLKQQIDHLMTGDAGRDGVAEGRRGTHVEVLDNSKQLDYELEIAIR